MSAAGFASRLRSTRDRLGLTRERVARVLECDQRTIQRWERGDFEPSVSAIAKLAALYGVSAHYLITGKNESAA